MSTIKRALLPVVLATLLGVAGAACGSSGNGGGGSAASFCETLETFEKDSEAFEDIDAEPGSKEFTDAMNRTAEAVQKLKQTAPSEIADDMGLLADYSEAMLNIDYENPQEAESFMEDFDLDRLTEASENMDAYAAEHCDLDQND